MTEKTFIKGKDSDLETSIATMQAKLKSFGFDIEEASWLNPVSNVYSVHIRDKTCPLMFTNGKGSSEKPVLPVRWVNISNDSAAIISLPTSIWANITAIVNLCIIPTNAGLTWKVMKCPKA